MVKCSSPSNRTLHTIVRRPGPPLPQAPMCLPYRLFIQGAGSTGNTVHPPPLVLSELFSTRWKVSNVERLLLACPQVVPMPTPKRKMLT